RTPSGNRALADLAAKSGRMSRSAWQESISKTWRCHRRTVRPGTRVAEPLTQPSGRTLLQTRSAPVPTRVSPVHSRLARGFRWLTVGTPTVYGGKTGGHARARTHPS